MQTIELQHANDRIFYDNLIAIYFILPRFQKTKDELITDQDKWFYIFRHLQELQDIPPVLQEGIFLKLFETAQIAHFNPAECDAYEDSLKYYRDLENVVDTAWQEGYKKGLLLKSWEEGRLEEERNIAQKLRAEGLSEAQVARIIGSGLGGIGC